MSRANMFRKSSLCKGVHKVMKSVGRKTIVKGVSEATSLFHYYNITDKHYSYNVQANPEHQNVPYKKQYVQVPILDEEGKETGFETKLANPIDLTGYHSGMGGLNDAGGSPHRNDLVQLVPIRSSDEKNINRAGANLRTIVVTVPNENPRSKVYKAVESKLFKAIYHDKEVIAKGLMEAKKHRA